MEKDPSRKSLNRRSFLAGLSGFGASVLAGTSAHARAPEESLRPQARPADLAAEELAVRAEAVERLKDEVYGAYESLEEQILHYSTVLEQDVDLVLDRAYSLVEDYEQYESFFALMQGELAMPDLPESLQDAVQALMVTVPFVESRLDTGAESRAGAFGVLQLMPETWNDLTSPEMVKEDLVAQVHVAARLLEQTYRFLIARHAETFELIVATLFDSDQERFEREFLAPVLCAAYFAGMGSVANTLDGFLHDYVTAEDAARMRALGISDDTYGVYSLFSTAGVKHGYDKNFGPETNAYVPKTLAANVVLRTSVLPEEYDRLMRRPDSATDQA